MPAEIGATLREARMRARIDISEIEAQTKIRAKYLRALENEEWDLLPGPTFVKSFLRTYAQALDLDDKSLIEEYRQYYERPNEADLQPIVPTSRQSQSGRGNARRARPARSRPSRPRLHDRHRPREPRDRRPGRSPDRRRQLLKQQDADNLRPHHHDHGPPRHHTSTNSSGATHTPTATSPASRASLRCQCSPQSLSTYASSAQAAVH